MKIYLGDTQDAFENVDKSVNDTSTELMKKQLVVDYLD